MSNWHLELSCPRCAGDLTFINGTRHGNEVGSLTVAIVVCEPCSHQYEINIRMKPLPWTSAEINQRSHDKAKEGR